MKFKNTKTEYFTEQEMLSIVEFVMSNPADSGYFLDITPTGIGVRLDIRTDTGVEEDISDYDKW